MNGYLENLNQEQKKAVTLIDGAVLVLAGAGTGKTTTIISRVLHLIANGIQPENILLLTFTNKASNEMLNRVKLQSPTLKQLPFIGTFHKFGHMFLTRHSGLVDKRNSNFRIIDNSEIKSLIRQILKDKLLSVELSADEVMRDISNLKNDNIHPDEKEKSNLKGDYRDKLFDIYQAYEDLLINNNLVDLDDLQLITYRILKEYKQLAEQYSRTYQYIMIDEFQDTNIVQYEIIKLLLSCHKNIFVVGDDDQSIYGWRGAEVTNILNFEKEFQNVRTVTLVKNYRSKSEIVEVANNLIEYNMFRLDKKIVSYRGSGGEVIYKNFPEDSLETMFVGNEIERLIREQGVKPSEIAVLYRINTLSFNIEHILLEKKIGYSIKGRKSIYSRSEIKEIINYLNLIADPNDNISFINVLKQTTGVGAKSIEIIINESKSENLSIYQTVKTVNIKFLLKTRARYLINLVDKLDDLIKSIENNQDDFVKIFEDTFDIRAKYITKRDSSTTSKETKEKLQDKIENIDLFYSLLDNFFKNRDDETIKTFLNLYAINGGDETESDNEKVSLVSIHLSKGLEFRYVFLIGMNDGILPTFANLDNEEERRLAYVALTRAKDCLYLTSASKRLIYGNYQEWKESRYLYEAKILKSDFRKRVNKPIFKSKQEMILMQNQTFKVGDRVHHKKFGYGTVVAIANEGNQRFLSIDFQNDPKGLKSRKMSERVIEKV